MFLWNQRVQQDFDAVSPRVRETWCDGNGTAIASNEGVEIPDDNSQKCTESGNVVRTNQLELLQHWIGPALRSARLSMTGFAAATAVKAKTMLSFNRMLQLGWLTKDFGDLGAASVAASGLWGGHEAFLVQLLYASWTTVKEGQED